MRYIVILTPADHAPLAVGLPSALTDEGVMRARVTYRALAMSYDLVLTIPCPASAQTAHIIASAESPMSQEVPEPKGFSESIYGKMLAVATEQFGRRSLKELLKRGLETSVRAAAYQYYGAITRLIDTKKADRTLIIADAVLAPMIGMLIVPHMPESVFLDRPLEPCQGYRFTLPDEASARFEMEYINK